MHAPCRQSPRGFTLIELMVAVVIVGILAAVAYPSYTSFVQRSRRADAIAVLTAVVQAQERYRSNSTAYASNLTDLGVSASAVTKYYDLSIAGVGSPPALTAGYVATASALSTGLQSGDTTCAKMTVQLQGAVLQYLATSVDNSDTSQKCWTR